MGKIQTFVYGETTLHAGNSLKLDVRRGHVFWNRNHREWEESRVYGENLIDLIYNM
jgi:hypothetical protein